MEKNNVNIEAKEMWLVVEVRDHKLVKTVAETTRADAVEKANELLEAYVADIDCEDAFKELKEDMVKAPEADKDAGEIEFARVEDSSKGAWCDWRDYSWDAFVIKVENSDSAKDVAVAKKVTELLDENQDNLVDGSDVYAKGYHDALLDVLLGLGLPVDAKYGKHID